MLNLKATINDKKFYKNCAYTIAMTALVIFTSCKKGAQGPPDFAHTVSITGAVCDSINQTLTLELQNNASYTAILASPALDSQGLLSKKAEKKLLAGGSSFLLNYGIYCTDNTTQDEWTNLTTVLIPALSTGKALLPLTSENNTCYLPPCPTAGTVFYCTIFPFSQELGWYASTTETITCN